MAILTDFQLFLPQTKSLLPGTYQLSASSYDPVMMASYVDVQDLIFKKRLSSVFIQTDKAIYKAGDFMQFRVFAVDSETRPENLIASTVTILDPNDLKIKIFANNTFVKGKYENNLQLSDSPALGVWKIKVDVGGEVSVRLIIAK